MRVMALAAAGNPTHPPIKKSPIQQQKPDRF
jgi:hypothetical protein